MPIQPTADQFEEARRAFEAFGARVCILYDKNVGDSAWEEHRYFQLNDATDADLRALPSVPFAADLGKTAITDAGLKHLVGLKNLATPSLSSTAVTDGGLALIGKLKNLQHLYLWHSLVTKSGVASLSKALPRCQIQHSGIRA